VGQPGCPRRCLSSRSKVGVKAAKRRAQRGCEGAERSEGSLYA